MSFLSDLFEGNTGNLGRDITQAPASLVAHPDELAETLGGAALVAAPFVLPGLLGGFGADALAAGGADVLAGETAAGADLAGLGTLDAAGAGGLADVGLTDTAAELGAAAPGTDVGTLASLGGQVGPGAGLTPVSAAGPAGGVVSPLEATGLGQSDVLANAGGTDLLGVDQGALPETSRLAAYQATDFPGGLSDSGIPSQATSLPGTTGMTIPDTSGALEGGVGQTGQPGQFLQGYGMTEAPLPDMSGGGAAAAAQPAAPELPAATNVGGGAVPQAPMPGEVNPEAIPAAPAAPQQVAASGVAAPAGAPAAPAAPAPAAANSNSALGGAFATKPGWGWTAAGLGLAAAPLAYLGLKGSDPLPPQANQLQGVANQTQAAAGPALASIAQNAPTAYQAAQLAQMQDQMVTQWKQTLMSQGVQNPEADTRWPQIQQYIQQQMNINTQAMINTNIQTALGFTGQTSSALTSLANMQIAQDTAYTTAVGNATKSLGTVAALGAMSKAA